MTTETLMTDSPAGESAAGVPAGTAGAGAGAAAQGAADAKNPAAGAAPGDGTAAAKAGDKAGAGADADKGSDEQKPAGAPEKYEFKAPDGIKFDDQVIDAFSAVAKDLNLSQDQAQKVLDNMAPVLASRATEQLKAARVEWVESAKTDKEFGGDGLQANLGVAKKAMEAFATPELRALLNESGLGDHPEVIRLFFRAGKAISEDGFVGGKPGASAPTSIAQRMYPNMNP